MRFDNHLFGCLALCLLSLALPALAAPLPEAVKIGGFALGCQAYTFNRFSAFEAIEKTASAGGKIIEFYPGQTLRPGENTKWDHNASDEIIQSVKEKLAQHQIVAVNYGVVGAKGEAEWRKVFEFGKKLGLYAITTEAVTELDLVEKLVKEFDIRVAIHEHARRANDAEYKLWDPNYVLSLVKNRDRRIGACADTGHWATSGIKPLDAIKILEGRIISSHLKERKEIGKQLPDAIYGTGVCDIPAILKELRRQGFEGNISIEYENNWEKSVPDVAQCVGFIRGWASHPDNRKVE
jgi:sugar phosphate isomerase/epimerase